MSTNEGRNASVYHSLTCVIVIVLYFFAFLQHSNILAGVSSDYSDKDYDFAKHSVQVGQIPHKNALPRIIPHIYTYTRVRCARMFTRRDVYSSLKYTCYVLNLLYRLGYAYQ